MDFSQVKYIFDILRRGESPYKNLYYFFVDSKIQGIYIIAIFISILAWLFSWLLGENELLTFSVYCFLISFSLYALSSFISQMLFVLDSSRKTIDSISTQYGHDIKAAEDISQYSNSSIDTAKIMIERRISFLKNRAGLLVGFIDKVGFVPTIMVAYFSYLKIKGSISFDDFHPIIWGLVSGVYLGAFVAKTLIEKFEDHIAILELAIKLKMERKGFKLP
ncbi:hypothetical protein [Aliivibrio fischeri]|uniref:hypothetical protein n=1 Tax=Aliivibrio fischeri TaxID=668 RepID=UPI0007C54D17|nr:hypothetical protein [Aliivibrio fischeri]